MDVNKEKVLETVNSILGAVDIHKSFLVTFIEGDGLKLQSIEQLNSKINIHYNQDRWGINTLGFLNTILSTLVDDSLFFIADESTGILKEVIWESQLGERGIKK